MFFKPVSLWYFVIVSKLTKTLVFLIFTYSPELASSVLSFHSEGLLLAFLSSRFTGDELFQPLFIWKCLNFSFILKGQFFHIQNSRLTVFFYDFKYVIPLLAGFHGLWREIRC